MKKLSKKLSLLLLFAVCFSVGIPCLAAGTASVNLTASQNYADSAVVRCEDGETTKFKGKVLSNSKKNATFVARYQRSAKWFDDTATIQRAVPPNAQTKNITTSEKHRYFILRIVSGNDANGFLNKGTIANGTIWAN
ncbi:MAG: hypothetical protein J6D02_11015 [Lachnospira sp.]|nr:hypothetical protein [Lachnospira sp.]